MKESQDVSEDLSRSVKARVISKTPRSLFVYGSTYFKRMRPTNKCPARAPWMQIFWSGLGAFLGIVAIRLLAIGAQNSNAIFLIGSFGASAVLVYGAPMAAFSQPRNVIGGHVISAAVGVAFVHLFAQVETTLVPDFIAPPLAVATSIVLMHLTRTLHPPGGASALIAVIGGPHIQQLGWWYILSPVGVGAVAMVLVAIIVNNLSNHRAQHYPTYWF